MRRELLYLEDLVEAADAVARFIAVVDEARFLEDELVQSAVLQKLIVIGEAASKVSRDSRETHSHIPWRAIISFRNFAVHEYFAVDWRMVWKTAVDDVPQLRDGVRGLLRPEDS